MTVIWSVWLHAHSQTLGDIQNLSRFRMRNQIFLEAYDLYSHIKVRNALDLKCIQLLPSPYSIISANWSNTTRHTATTTMQRSRRYFFLQAELWPILSQISSPWQQGSVKQSINARIGEGEEGRFPAGKGCCSMQAVDRMTSLLFSVWTVKN